MEQKTLTQGMLGVFVVLLGISGTMMAIPTATPRANQSIVSHTNGSMPPVGVPVVQTGSGGDSSSVPRLNCDASGNCLPAIVCNAQGLCHSP